MFKREDCPLDKTGLKKVHKHLCSYIPMLPGFQWRGYNYFSFCTFPFPEILHPLGKSLTRGKISDHPVDV